MPHRVAQGPPLIRIILVETLSLLQTTQTTPPPGVIDYSVGQPQLSLLPLDLMHEAAARRFAVGDPRFLQYGAEQGDGYFRVALAKFLTQNYGVPVNYEQLFVSASATQALDLLLSLYTQPGDTIFVEEPSYFYAFRIFSDHRLKLVSIPTDDDGVIIDALVDELKRQRPTVFYTIPTFHNPTSATLPRERREQLASLSRAYDFLVIADEVYHCLYFDAPPPEPMAAYLEQGNICSLGSFSKILAPGLRIGWVQANGAMIERLLLAGLVDSGGGLNPFTSAIVRTVLEEGWQQNHVERLRDTYGARARVLSAALRAEIGEWATFREPLGGFFTWVALDESIDASQLLKTAERYKVGFQPGTKSSTRQGLRNYIRFSYAHYDNPDLVEGAARLRQTLLAYHGK